MTLHSIYHSIIKRDGLVDIANDIQQSYIQSTRTASECACYLHLIVLLDKCL